MNLKTRYYFIQTILITSFVLLACVSGEERKGVKNEKILAGAERTTQYLPLLKGKRVAIVANHTSKINNVHLVDSLIKLDINIVKIFSPEHGFRGKIDAGKTWDNYEDEKTNLRIISLYGDNKKPADKDLENIDIVIFDIQDVGVRFYTYISTMHYVMEACAENDVGLLILDRPNPTGFYIDGPVLEKAHHSFVGMHPVPIVHGMTIAEYAKMINGEKWLKNGIRCKLYYVECKNYTHNSRYHVKTNPSPNLQNMKSIYLYPSLGLFEGTKVSIGKGTSLAFRVFGHPGMLNTNYSFTPEKEQKDLYILKYKGEKCYGVDLRDIPLGHLKKQDTINLNWLIFAYTNTPDKEDFFNPFFCKLAGTKKLEHQIRNGKSAKEIRKSWEKDLQKYKTIRKKYLLYPGD